MWPPRPPRGPPSARWSRRSWPASARHGRGWRPPATFRHNTGAELSQLSGSTAAFVTPHVPHCLLQEAGNLGSVCGGDQVQVQVQVQVLTGHWLPGGHTAGAGVGAGPCWVEGVEGHCSAQPPVTTVEDTLASSCVARAAAGQPRLESSRTVASSELRRDTCTGHHPYTQHSHCTAILLSLDKSPH